MKNEESVVTDTQPTQRKVKANALVEMWPTGVQAALSTLGLAYIVSATLGGILVFLYCARYLFHPGDISAGDALSFALQLFCFLLILVFVFGIVTLAGFPILRLLGAAIDFPRFLMHRFRNRKLPRKNVPRFVRLITWREGHTSWLSIGVMVLLVYGLVTYVELRHIVQDLIPIVVVGVVLSGIAFAKLRQPKSNLPLAASDRFTNWLLKCPGWLKRILLASAFIGVTVLLSWTFFQNATWRVMGVRKENVTVRLPEEDFKVAIAYAGRNGIVINPCQQIGHDTTVKNLDVIWHNLGKKALLLYPAFTGAATATKPPILRLEPDADDIDVIHETNRYRCEEVAADQMFMPDSVDVSAAGRAWLANRLEWLNEDTRRAWKIRVVAHRGKADKVQVIADKTSTQRQAESVKTALEQALGLAQLTIDAIGEEDTVPKCECDDDMTTLERRRCEKMSYRVEIFVVPKE